jgi:hypothetical protein
MMRWISFALIFLLPSISEARSFSVRTLDEAGNPFSNVLIIVRSLDRYQEKGRFLTDAKGETPELQVDGGLHQVIATCPYGFCKTMVREFLPTSSPNVIVLHLPERSTDEIGELINGPMATLVFNPPQAGREVSTPVDILVRDAEAVRQEWYRADKKGKVTVKLLGGDNTFFVVSYAGAIYRYALSDGCKPSMVGDPELTCALIPRPYQPPLQ